MKEGKRIPSYTDRILFGSRSFQDLKDMEYKKISKILFSDHRPVFLRFTTFVNKMTSTHFLNDFHNRMKEYNYLN